ncbi:MAG TPA: DUF367 domain-containing protein [Thermoplasmata archaeon]|nr:DUF367 domain-containing protein [Thermoplasmata archaeon]
MRSSASTPSRRPSGPVPLLLVVLGEDHPKACTGRQLVRAGSVREVPVGRPPHPAPLLLDPRADTPLAPSDRDRALSSGLLGVDASWNRIGRRGGYPRDVEWLARLSARRRLPWLLAANPQHFGRLAELNTAEAFAAALRILGEPARAGALIAPFAGGPAFLALNRTALEAYAGARDAAEVRAAERAALERGWQVPEPDRTARRRGRASSA